ncbi:hypothetical protein P7H47_09175 [Enterococcus cecorum]|uniref:Uncharacterized protein n=1 Tax=Enterococcus cecorum TaxID=44008 RepID=A0AAW8TTK1_9ENTE|nr:hypothetical protein [Enterococcus cecorum]MDT2797407.1 hypothetical protein [Enterococcus cecorum]
MKIIVLHEYRENLNMANRKVFISYDQIIYFYRENEYWTILKLSTGEEFRIAETPIEINREIGTLFEITHF